MRAMSMLAIKKLPPLCEPGRSRTILSILTDLVGCDLPRKLYFHVLTILKASKRFPCRVSRVRRSWARPGQNAPAVPSLTAVQGSKFSDSHPFSRRIRFQAFHRSASFQSFRTVNRCVQIGIRAPGRTATVRARYRRRRGDLAGSGLSCDLFAIGKVNSSTQA